jgi:vancomycin permeability regulator SanA
VAVRLYLSGKVDKVYLTVSASAGEIPMAEAMRGFLVGQEVKERGIVVNRRGGNTAGELDVFLSLVPRGEKVIFISTWYHLPRIVWLALWQGLRPGHFSLGVAWRYATIRNGLAIELLKIANAVLRPRSSAKILPQPPP